MKKSLLFVVFSLWMVGKAQWVNIPDTLFATWLDTTGYSQCLQGNNTVGWQMDTTCNKIINSISLTPSGIWINDLTGITYFDNLDTLICRFNQLNSLPTLPSSLKILFCENNHLVSLPHLPNSLKELQCDFNELINLPQLPLGLTKLSCSSNQLTNLPQLPDSLLQLICQANQLTTLPEFPDSLGKLWTYNNPVLYCMPELKKVRHLMFQNTGITCLPNYPQSNIYSFPSLSGYPLCDTIFPNPCATTGISQFSIPNSEFSIYPNPATNSVTITVDARLNDEVGQETMLGSTATVYDITGRKMAAAQLITNNTSLITASFSSGIYFVTIENEKGRATKKLVIEK